MVIAIADVALVGFWFLNGFRPATSTSARVTTSSSLTSSCTTTIQTSSFYSGSYPSSITWRSIIANFSQLAVQVENSGEVANSTYTYRVAGPSAINGTEYTEVQWELLLNGVPSSNQTLYFDSNWNLTYITKGGTTFHPSLEDDYNTKVNFAMLFLPQEVAYLAQTGLRQIGTGSERFGNLDMNITRYEFDACYPGYYLRLTMDEGILPNSNLAVLTQFSLNYSRPQLMSITYYSLISATPRGSS